MTSSEERERSASWTLYMIRQMLLTRNPAFVLAPNDKVGATILISDPPPSPEEWKDMIARLVHDVLTRKLATEAEVKAGLALGMMKYRKENNL